MQLTSQILGLLSVVADINCKSEAGPTSIAKSHPIKFESKTTGRRVGGVNPESTHLSLHGMKVSLLEVY